MGTVTTLGKGRMATILSSEVTKIGIGDDSTAESASHTDLQAGSTASERFVATLTSSDKSVSGGTVTFSKEIGSSDGNFQWYEVATFNSSDVMIARGVLDGSLTKSSGETATIEQEYEY